MNRAEYVRVFDILARTQTHMAECARIERTDGRVFRFTAHDNDIQLLEELTNTYQVYQRANSFALSSIETGNGLQVSNMDIDAIIDDDSITEDDLRDGLFDNARCDIFLAYWRDRTVRVLPLRVSWMGEVQIENQKFKVDLRGIAQRLAQTFVRATSLESRTRYLDQSIGIDPATYTTSHTIQTVPDLDQFTADITLTAGEYQWGSVTFLTGNNAGTSMEIINHWNQNIRLFLPPNRSIEVGDTISITQGFNGTFDQACQRYGLEAARCFDGEPFLAGSDILTRYPVRDSAATPTTDP